MGVETTKDVWVAARLWKLTPWPTECSNPVLKDHITSPAQRQMLYCIRTSPSASLLSAKPSALTQTEITTFSSAVCKVRRQHSHLPEAELTWKQRCGIGGAQERPPVPALIHLPPQHLLDPAANHHKPSPFTCRHPQRSETQ